MASGAGGEKTHSAMQSDAVGAEVPPPRQVEPRNRLPFEFTGTAGEYFRIWIVNVLLSILTLGIYSAWAKVRTKTYFCRHTRVDGTSFDYHADPRRILMGRIIIGVFFAALFLSQYYSLVAYGVLLCGLFLMMPWLTIKALSFNARYSSFRNVRFSFLGRLPEAFWVQCGLPILSILSLGVLGPYADWRFRRFLAANHRYGTQPFTFKAAAYSFYVMYVCAIALTLVCILGLMMVVFVVAFAVAFATGGMRQDVPPPAEGETMYYFVGAAIYLMMLIPAVYLRANTANLFYSQTSLGDHRFRSQQRTLALFWIYLSNIVAIFCSLGLLVPWAKVRLARYRARCLSLLPQGSLTFMVDREQQEQTALGEAAADFGDLDFGL